MFDDDHGERILPPTERRRREARQHGEVALSPSLTSAICICSVFVLIFLTDPLSIESLLSFMRKSLTSIPENSLSVDSSTRLVYASVATIGMTLLPIAIVILTSLCVAHAIQVGWFWDPAAITFRVRFGRLVSFESFSDAIGSTLRLGILASITVHFLSTHCHQLSAIGLFEPLVMLVETLRMVTEFGIQLALAVVMLGLLDYGIRYWRHEQRLKMTIEERRREERDESIDPQIKKQRKSVHDRRHAPTLSGIQPISTLDKSD